MKLPCIRYDQPGASFYACVVRATDIAGRLDVRRRSRSNEGIQRDEDVRRVRQISEYLKGSDAILPTPIVVSAYSGKVVVHGDGIEITEGHESIGHILDGQHRVLGLRDSGDDVASRVELLIVFAFEIELYAQATIFSTINSNQRQVSKSLIYDLFGLDPKRSLERVAHEVVKSLNDEVSSPFYRRIKLLGKKVEESETLSQAAFIDHLLTAAQQENSKFGELYAEKEDWAIQKLVSNCFLGLEAARSRTKNSYPEEYFFRTTGYGGVMKTINALVFRGWAAGSVEDAYFREAFERFFSRYPEPPVGTGNSAMLQISRHIMIANGFSG